MKIEFKKVPQDKKEFNSQLNSVKIEGTFCRISTSLVKIEAKLSGEISVDCSRCPKDKKLIINEDLKLIICDGIFKSQEEDDFLVIEVENGLIDFDYIIQSELDSIKSDYHLCIDCTRDSQPFEQEF